jgi:micrococcal nuclease
VRPGRARIAAARRAAVDPLLALLAVAVAVAVATVGCGVRGPGDGVLPANGTVTDTTDGDTLRIRIDGVEEKVRLIGIDTPESVSPSSPVECFGPEASRRLAELAPAGTPVRVVLDAEARDRYGRLLAYVYRAEDGRFLNLILAAEGYAEELTIEPNVAHTDDVRSAVSAARRGGLGLWSACTGDAGGR